MTDKQKLNPENIEHEPTSKAMGAYGTMDGDLGDLITGDALPQVSRGEMSLDDQRRVKVLSPGMLVFKRFIRNRLAVVGLIILAIMFTFSFLGPVFVPYTQAQTFKKMKVMPQEYAGAIFNAEERYTVAQDQEFGSAERAAYLFARSKDAHSFKAGDQEYYYDEVIPDFYRIVKLSMVAQTLPVGGLPEELPAFSDDEEKVEAFSAAFEANKREERFVFEDTTYIITGGKIKTISTEEEIAVASTFVFDTYNPKDRQVVQSHAFKLASAKAIADNASSFEVDGNKYSLEIDNEVVTIKDASGEEFAQLSDIIVNPRDANIFLSVEFKSVVREAMNDRLTKFTYTEEDGSETNYFINIVNQNYSIMRDTSTEVISTFESPSATHILGTDNNGMDVLTRLMYGGRVSLMVGFVVVIIEMIIGVIVGGISGYFGGTVDTLLMRFVDLFNSIPFYPIVIIFGSVMDALQVDATRRIFLLMAILGVLGWTGIARVVRGQILSLREQDFMVATEATGIRTSRRIFRHLVPNVMPLLIVSATGSLGGIIISEATLGFLGLGVKYPLASWGSIINLASTQFIMETYWFLWIPAGLLILLTVLGFNFVGDGLRDAYDPKMKR